MTQFLYIHPGIISVEELYQAARDSLAENVLVRDQLAAFADCLYQAHQAQNHVCVSEINNWHLELVGKSAAEVLAYDFSLEDAQHTLARQFGFASWAEVTDHQERLDPLFESSVDAMMNGEIDLLEEKLNQAPSLIHQKSAYGHRATLLLYLGTNGVETWRQKVPVNMMDMLHLLLKKGANPLATMNVYGGQFTTRQLAGTSGHIANAQITEEMLEVLERAELNKS